MLKVRVLLVYQQSRTYLKPWHHVMSGAIYATLQGSTSMLPLSRRRAKKNAFCLFPLNEFIRGFLKWCAIINPRFAYLLTYLFPQFLYINKNSNA